jgi:hypothetical protein
MKVLEPTNRAALSVVEVASLCHLSVSRFHALVRLGVFPKAVRSSDGRRAHYPSDLVKRCCEIRATGIGENGSITLFNRPAKRKSASSPKPAQQQPINAELNDSLAELGVIADQQAVVSALNALFPGGIIGVEPSEVTRKVFLFLQRNRR